MILSFTNETDDYPRGMKVGYNNVMINTHLKTDFNPIFYSGKGSWIDLKVPQDIFIEPHSHAMIDLGLSMMIPDDFEVHLLPRSSTYSKYQITLANMMGIIDEDYSGTEDYWLASALYHGDEPLRIEKGTRLFQFRFVRTMTADFADNNVFDEVHIPILNRNLNLIFKFCEKLNDINRGGYGSTGD